MKMYMICLENYPTTPYAQQLVHHKPLGITITTQTKPNTKHLVHLMPLVILLWFDKGSRLRWNDSELRIRTSAQIKTDTSVEIWKSELKKLIWQRVP
ncbi:hypothetical protein O3M35_011551 [Rhynocoris fuscipes]|uniref:Uncharacterized protein n=1 Tax=Rhynocoris fuscipes TaxID=488301 RepID=A0AAW1D1V8_9HEMI